MELWREGRALKASLRGEGTGLKVAGSHHQLQVQVQVVAEELTRASSTEDFSVECFLDFSQDRRLLLHEESQENKLISLSSSSSQEQELDCNFASQTCVFDQFPSFPDEDVEELEWVSRVVDDSSSPEVSLLFTQNKPQQLQPHKTKPPSLISSPIPVKPRTKRPRNSLTVPKHWPLFSTPSTTHKKPVTTSVFQRRCSHCGTNNTPQWRSGPLGPKTLCNACGVRYKSGRLCPEYRPADSPSFSNQIHSNLHRKVLELRKSKELGDTGESTQQNESNLAEGRKT